MFQQLFDMSEDFAVKKMNHEALCLSIFYFYQLFEQ